MNYSAQGGITIKRMRNGDTIFLTFDLLNKIPLYQGVDKNTGVPSPDWKNVDANRPIIRPNVSTAKSASVTLSNHSWTYNGAVLVFNGSADGSYIKDSTGKFEINPQTGELKIIDNLASKTNYANDTLVYTCTATVSGYEYTLKRSIDVEIQVIGASSYAGFIMATTEQLTETVTTTILSAILKLVGVNIDNYYVKWYTGADNTEVTLEAGKNSITPGTKTLTVDRDMVNGSTLFIAAFFLSADDATSGKDPVHRAGIRIIDTGDCYQIVYYISSKNKEVDSGKDVEVTGQVKNMRTGLIMDLGTSPNWDTDVMDAKTWKSLKHTDSNVIVVTTNETDTDNGENDVEVTGTVSWQ